MSKKFLGIARLFIFSVFLFLPTVVYAEIFFQDDFESGVLINQQIWEWIANNPNDPCYSDGQIVPTTEDKFSGVYSAKFTLPSGDMCTSMYSQFSRSVGQGEDIYFRFRLKYLANREWNLGGGDKVAGFFGNSRAPGGEWILFTLERGYHDTGIVIPVPNDPHMAQPLIYVAAANTNGWRPCNDPEGSYFCQNIDQENPFYMTAGQWYTVEIYVKVDAYGAGQLKLWINGKQLIDINNIYTIRGATNPGFYRFELGGTLNQPDYVFPVDTVSYWDDVIISDTCNSCDQPSAQITSPTNSGTYTTTNSTINLSGTATDPAGTNIGISSVIYSNDRGGSGNCSGTTSWACDNISLQSGQNIITVTAIDGDNKTGVDTLVVTVTTSGGGSNNNGSSGGEASGGSGCGFVKDNNGKGPKSQGIGGESGNISIIANLALLFLFLTLLKLRVIFYGNMGGYRMKINKLFSLLMLSLAFFLQPSALNAAVNLPWSTTYNCPDWTQSNGLSNITCDGLSTHGGWTCSNGDGTVEEEQITVAANYSGGSGGKGQRHWKGDGTNNVSGGLRIAFNSPQSELWIRWYMRYEQGFEWNPLVQDKILYIDVGTHPFLIFGYNWPDEIQFSADGNPYSVGTGNGWNTIMVNGTTDARGNKRSDGQWHLYEIHIKMDTNGGNGIGEVWIDGIKRFFRSDMDFGSQTGKIGWSHIAIGENNQIPTTTRCMYVDFDDIIISTTGPIGGGVDAQAPSVPAGLTAQAVSSSQINLSWTASTDNVGVAGYRVYRNGSQIDTTSTTSYSNTGLSASTTYTYSVSAYDAVGNNSAQTSNVSATTQAQAGGGGGDTGGNTGGGDASGGSGCGFVRDSSSNKVSESQSIRATDINLLYSFCF